MKSFDDIHDMIATAQAGDGNRLLDICQSLLDQLRKIDRQVEVLDTTKVDMPLGGLRFSDHATELKRYRDRFVRAECLNGHAIRTATAMDLDAFEKVSCPERSEGKRCGATLTIERQRAPRDLAPHQINPLLRKIAAASVYDPGETDLDDEQPVNLSITLGDVRTARRLLGK